VGKVCSEPLRSHFEHRLSQVAAAELSTLEELTDEVLLQTEPDDRTSPLADKDGVLCAGPIYAALMNLQAEEQCPFYKFV